jgi:hypothetical protein
MSAENTVTAHIHESHNVKVTIKATFTLAQWKMLVAAYEASLNHKEAPYNSDSPVTHLACLVQRVIERISGA